MHHVVSSSTKSLQKIYNYDKVLTNFKITLLSGASFVNVMDGALQVTIKIFFFDTYVRGFTTNRCIMWSRIAWSTWTTAAVVKMAHFSFM